MKKFEVGNIYTTINANDRYAFRCLNIFTSYTDDKRYVVVSDGFDFFECFEILENKYSEYFEYGRMIKIYASTGKEDELLRARSAIKNFAELVYPKRKSL